MSHSLLLEVMIGRVTYPLSSGCISFRLDKERYTPYTELHAQWYCPKNINISEVVTVSLKIDNVIRHRGFPTDVQIIKKDGRTILDVASRGYSALLAANQCADGLIPDVNLTQLVSKAGTFPNVAYQTDTPTVNYVYYYDGTSVWDAIICYSIRAADKFPYIAEHNTVRISPPATVNSFSVTSGQLISRSYCSDFTRPISKITMKDIDGTPNAFGAVNSATSRRSIVRMKELNFDREWTQDPQKGITFKFNYSMRGLSADRFSFLGYSALDLMDTFSVSDINYNHEVDRIRIEASAEKGFVTTVWCYHDGFCK